MGLFNINKCKLFGHKWEPVFIKGDYNDQTVMFIGCYCLRCEKGFDEVHKISEAAENRQLATYSEKYFDIEKDS